MRLDALAEVAFRQVQVSFQILRRSQFRHVPGSKHSKTFLLEILRLFSKFRDDMTILNKILFGLLKFYFTLNTGRKTTSYTFSRGSLQYFTSHSDTKKNQYSRAF